jgi:hypothetical protein
MQSLSLSVPAPRRREQVRFQLRPFDLLDLPIRRQAQSWQQRIEQLRTLWRQRSVDYRHPPVTSPYDRLPALATELVSKRVTVIAATDIALLGKATADCAEHVRHHLHG